MCVNLGTRAAGGVCTFTSKDLGYPYDFDFEKVAEGRVSRTGIPSEAMPILWLLAVTNFELVQGAALPARLSHAHSVLRQEVQNMF